MTGVLRTYLDRARRSDTTLLGPDPWCWVRPEPKRAWCSLARGWAEMVRGGHRPAYALHEYACITSDGSRAR